MPNQVPATAHGRKNMKRNLLLFGVPLIILASAGIAYLQGGRYVETENAYVKSNITNISAEISGRIINVLVHENQQVKAGDTLLTIDPTPYKLAVEKARANIDNIKTDLKTIQAEYKTKLADIAVAKSQFEYLQREENRQLGLLKKKYISQSEYDAAKQKTHVQQLELTSLKVDLNRIRASLGGNVETPVSQHPRVLSAIAQLEEAKNQLAHINILAPSDGVITQVSKIGQFLSPGTPAMVLVSNHDLWIEANFTEAEMSHVKAGQSVEINVDYTPGYTWHGQVSSISPATGSEFSIIPAQNATGNWVKIAQRIPVRISIESATNAPQLRAGLSATVAVDTEFTRHLSL